MQLENCYNELQLLPECANAAPVAYRQELSIPVENARGRSASAGGIQLPRVQRSTGQWRLAH